MVGLKLRATFTKSDVNFERYLEQIKVTIDEKPQRVINPKIIVFYQDNAKPHFSLQMKKKFVQLSWDVRSKNILIITRCTFESPFI